MRAFVVVMKRVIADESPYALSDRRSKTAVGIINASSEEEAWEKVEILDFPSVDLTDGEYVEGDEVDLIDLDTLMLLEGGVTILKELY